MPIQDYCHPCMRVLWNKAVLAEEETHRERHVEGECGCGTVFKGVVEERLVRQREKERAGLMNGSGEIRGGEPGEDGWVMVGGDMKGKGKETEDARESWEVEAKEAAYNYTGYRAALFFSLTTIYLPPYTISYNTNQQIRPAPYQQTLHLLTPHRPSRQHLRAYFPIPRA